MPLAIEDDLERAKWFQARAADAHALAFGCAGYGPMEGMPRPMRRLTKGFQGDAAYFSFRAREHLFAALGAEPEE